MKYIGMPMGMCVLFGKSFERNPLSAFWLDAGAAKAVATGANPKYKAIIDCGLCQKICAR